MLAFDIETTGLKPERDQITVAAVCNRETGFRQVYNFITGGVKAQNDFLSELDNADSLCTFNGAKFDIMFVVKKWNIEKVVPSSHQY
jgi:uncharacterized protein YprB with RNaseH-like and TPR domain